MSLRFWSALVSRTAGPASSMVSSGKILEFGACVWQEGAAFLPPFLLVQPQLCGESEEQQKL